MGRTKKKFGCPRCFREFDTHKGLGVHRTRLSHWLEKPLPPPPEKKHVCYRDLVSRSHKSWGQEMTEYERKHPGMDQLKLGALFEIIDLLHELIQEVKRPR